MFNGQITQQLNEQGTWRRECYAKPAEVLSKAKCNHIIRFYQIWMKPWPQVGQAYALKKTSGAPA